MVVSRNRFEQLSSRARVPMPPSLSTLGMPPPCGGGPVTSGAGSLPGSPGTVPRAEIDAERMACTGMAKESFCGRKLMDGMRSRIVGANRFSCASAGDPGSASKFPMLPDEILDPTDGLLPTTFWSECSRPEYVRRKVPRISDRNRSPSESLLALKHSVIEIAPSFGKMSRAASSPRSKLRFALSSHRTGSPLLLQMTYLYSIFKSSGTGTAAEDQVGKSFALVSNGRPFFGTQFPRDAQLPTTRRWSPWRVSAHTARNETWRLIGAHPVALALPRGCPGASARA
mmetsp:Transcript_111406/g.239990  ORF Transcript_111406/g.239990 Transcript_111406/m.239990 type:complete len:285 (-) Transcript_111406:1-855(-)